MLSVEMLKFGLNARLFLILRLITFIIYLTGNESSEKGVVILSTLFKTQIKNIRREAIESGFNIATMDSYLKIWNNFIKCIKSYH